MIMSLITTTKKSRELHTNLDRDQYYQSSGTMTHKMEANFFLSSPIAQKQQGGSFFPSLSLSPSMHRGRLSASEEFLAN